jgi:hypothetical protein
VRAEARRFWVRAKQRRVVGKTVIGAVYIASVGFGFIHVDIAVFAFLVCLIASFFVSQAYAVRISRALESGGRFRARSAVGLWAGSLDVLDIVVVGAVCGALHIPVLEPGLVGAADAAFAGALMLACAFATGALTLAVVRVLRPRGRAGPHRPLNAIVGVLAHLLARAAVPLMAVVIVVVWVLGLTGHPPADVGSWVLVVILVPLSSLVATFFGDWIRRSMSGYADRLRPVAASDDDNGGWTLYLRPFTEENRLFAGSETLEQFLATEIGQRVGPLVGLGNPTDRIAPAGAERSYHDDVDWQASVERYAMKAACIIGVTGASVHTAWELTLIRELGLERRLFLLSPPARDQAVESPATTTGLSTTRRALRFSRELVNAYMADDTAKLTQLLAFGKLPAAWSPIGLTAWLDFVNALAACGYVVALEDPGDGAVLGFEGGGTALVLARGLRSPGDYVEAISSRLPHLMEGAAAPRDEPRT